MGARRWIFGKSTGGVTPARLTQAGARRRGRNQRNSRAGRAAHIIVLTTFDGDEDIYRAIKAGAKAYLLKDTAREALMDCIRRVHGGETCIPPALAAKLAERISGEALSAREIEVLQRIAAGKSNKEIGTELFISEGTVKSHVKSIFAKLNVISRTEAVATATRRGLLRL